MFPRRARLPRAAFATALRAPQRAGAHFSARLPKGSGYAVVISKKTLAKATRRHALKRRVLGALRQPPPLPLPPALIIYPRASAAGLTAREIRQALEELLARGGIQ